MSTRSARPGSSPATPQVRVRFEDFELDEANATLLRGGKPVALQPKPFAVLCALARQPAALLTKHALLDQVWGHQFVSDSVLKTAISDLRTALDDDARQPRFIETVSRRGYRFIAATISAQAKVAPITPSGTPFIGRAGRTFAPARRLGCRVRRQARGGLGRRRARHRQDDADRAFRRGPRRRDLRTRPMRRALRCRRTVSSGVSKRSRSCAEATVPSCPCCAPSRRPGSCSCRGSAPRRSAKRCDESSRESARIACCARWAKFSIARPSAGRCCW